MKHLKQKWKPLALVVFAMFSTCCYSYMDTSSNVYGLFSPTGSNKDLITFNDDWPPQIQDVETTTEAPALSDDVRFLGRDDVTPAGSTIAYDVNNDNVKYFRSKDDHVERSNKDAGAYNQISTNRTQDQIAEKFPKMSRAKHRQCDARNLSNTPAQFSWPDPPEKLTQAGDLPQMLAIQNTTMISSTCVLEQWCELQDPLKFKQNSGVSNLEIRELKQKDLDLEENALKSTLKPKSAANLRDHQTTLYQLPESYAESNQSSEIPNAVSGKTADIEALQKMSPVLEEDKIVHLKFHTDFIYLDDPKVRQQMLQRCEKDSFADLLYSDQPKDLSLIVEYVKNHPKATWTSGISEKFLGASNKEICKLMGNIADPKWKKNAPMKQSELIKNESLPVNFCFRESWPKCTNVGEQSDYDSCWAHGTTKALKDRACIKFQGAFQTLLSIADTIACCNSSACFPVSCNGGQVAPPYYQFKKTGFVSSSPFGQDEFFYDYTMPLRARQAEPTTLLLCEKVPTVTPVCGNFYPRNLTTEQVSDRVKSISSNGVGQTFDAIKKELFTYGSVNAAFTVFEDSLTYTQGVYQLLVNSWSNLWDDQGTFKFLMGDCGINDLKDAGRIGTHSKATKNAQNNDRKVISDSNNLKTCDKIQEDVEIAPTSETLAQAQTQACEDTTRPELKTTVCNPADQLCLNSQLVAAYLADLDQCSTLETECIQNAVASSRKTCQGESSCIQALQAVVPKNAKKSWDSAKEPVARRTNYTHCKCYKAVAEDALTKLNESRPFMHEVGPNFVSLDNELLSNKCGIHDWNQFCGKLVFKNSPEDGSIQLDWQEHVSTHLKGRRLGAAASGQCTGPTTNYNLLNTDVQTIQSYGATNYNLNSNQGCDGVLQHYNPTEDSTRIVRVQANAGEWHWVATFQQTTDVTSILLIERQYISRVQFLVGDNPNFLNNLPCIGGQLTVGGWLDCSRSGKYLALISTTGEFRFMEVMCYSQYFVHHNALSSHLSSTLNTGTTYSCTTSTNCQASNVIRTTLVIWNHYPDPPKTKCCIYSQPQTDPTLEVTIPADLMIECVLISPSDQGTSNTALTNWQKNIEVSIVNSAGEKQICGTLSDYNLYTEVSCKKIGNKIVVTKLGNSMTLAMASASILSNCECNQNSLNPALISLAQSPLASPSTISTTSTAAPITVKLNKQMYDTVSSVCGNADGFTKCGLRTLVFTDKMTGFQITFPYKGFELNSDQSELTLSPAKAPRISVLTVTVKLDNYPKVTYQKDIIAIVEGADAVFLPLKLPKMALNTTIGQEAFLVLPKLDAQQTYVVASKQNFEASVDGNQLKVLSKNQADVGTYYLNLEASSSSGKVSFEVKVILALPTLSETQTTSSPVQYQAASNTKQVSSQAGDSLQSDPVLAQLQKVSCNDEGECFDPTNSRFSCYYDEETGKMVCGVDLVRKTKTSDQPKTLNTIVAPTMQVSRIDSKGFFTLMFSQPMNFTSLINEANSTSESIGNKSTRTNSSNQQDFKRYLLSAEQIKITIKCNSEQDSSKLQFEWVVINITETQVKIQILFKNPLSISSDVSSPDFLMIKLLPGFLEVKSKASNLIIMNPLRTVKQKIPNQLVLGSTTDTVEEVAETALAAGQAVVIGTFIMSVILSGVLGSMYLMVNSLQMLMIYSYMTVPMPANVTLVMVKINTIAQFDYLPTDEIFGKLFKFSTTVVPFVSFEAMGVQSLRLTLYLGTFFFILASVLVLSLIYLISWPFKNKFSFIGRFHSMMRDNYYWSGIIRMLLESYCDMSVGIMLSWREPRSITESDIFDLVLTCVVTLIVIGGPISQYFLFRKYANKLHEKRFQSTYGSLTEGYATTGVLGCQATRYMISWFLLRRFLTAVSIVYLGDQSTIWQISTIMYLSLADMLMNFHLNAFESKSRSIMAKINGIFVFLISYFPFVYSGLVHDPEQKYDIGWFQNSLCGSMFVINVAVVIHCYILSAMEQCRRKQVEQFNLRMLQKNGFNTKVMVQSVFQRLLRLIQIEWVYFDSIPPSINEQIAPYVEMYRFYYDFGCLINFEQRALIVFDIEKFGINQAEIVADQAEEFDIIIFEQAELLVDQYDEFSFYEKQKNSITQTSMIGKERIQISSQQSSRESQADQIIEEDAPIASVSNNKKQQRLTEETKSTPTQLSNNDWETKQQTERDQATVANKDASTQNNASDNKVMPAQKDAQGPALLQRRRKLIVEEAKDQKAELNQLKNQIFDTVMAQLQAAGDPIVSSDCVNSRVRQDSYLLPDDIKHMSEKDQESEVKHLISVCPEYFQLQNKLGKHQDQIAKLTGMEDLLKDVVKDKIAALDGLKKLIKFHKDKAARAPNHELDIARKEVLEAIKRLNDGQRNIKEDQEEIKRLAAEIAFHRGSIIFFSQF